jgi:hypothetical protein
MTYEEWYNACYATGKVADEYHFHPDNWGPDEEMVDITFTNGACTRFTKEGKDKTDEPSIWTEKQHSKGKACSKINYMLNLTDFINRLSIEVY